MRRQEKRRLEKEKKEKAIEEQEPDRKRSKFSDDAPGALHRQTSSAPPALNSFASMLTNKTAPTPSLQPGVYISLVVELNKNLQIIIRVYYILFAKCMEK